MKGTTLLKVIGITIWQFWKCFALGYATGSIAGKCIKKVGSGSIPRKIACGLIAGVMGAIVYVNAYVATIEYHELGKVVEE